MFGGAVRMRLITVNVPEHYLDGLDELVRRGLYPHRAEAIRLAIRDLLREELGLKTLPRRTYPLSPEGLKQASRDLEKSGDLKRLPKWDRRKIRNGEDKT